MTQQKIDHSFAFAQLAYDAIPNVQPYIKILFFFNKLPSVSDEYFLRHWETVHADLTVASKGFQVCKISRYTQIYQSAETKEKLRASGVKLIDYDACTEMWFESWDNYLRFLASPEWAQDLAPDGKLFMDGANITIFAGVENIIVGQAVGGTGQDGILLNQQDTDSKMH